MSDEHNRLQDLVADVAAAYFSNANVHPSDIAGVIAQIAASLGAVGATGADGASGAGPTVEAAAPAEPEPAAVPDASTPAIEPVKLTRAQINKSITPAALISFEDGKGYKTLKRHLGTRGLTLEQYRQKWGLPHDYPSVSPNYSAARSEMARSIGLGQKGRGGGKKA
jgi:predicted transcriptional regulator